MQPTRMPWQIPMLLYLATTAISPILLKRATGLPSRTRRIAWMFGFAASFSFALVSIIGAPIVHDLSAFTSGIVLAIAGGTTMVAFRVAAL